MENSIQGITYALISTASWAACAIIFKKLGERLEPLGMTAVKSLLSTFLLYIVILVCGINVFIGKDNLIPIMLSGILGIAIGDSLFFASLNRLSPIAVSLILFAGPDIFAGLFGFLFLGEIPSAITIFGILLILSGLGLFVFPAKNNSNNKTTFLGILFAFLSLICTAYSMVIIKPVLSNIPIVTATMYRMLFSALTLIFFAFVSKKIFNWYNILRSDKVYDVKLAGAITIATFGGFLFSLNAIKYCDLIVAGTLMSLEPLFILLFMVLFNKYKPQKREYSGLFFCLAGIIVICMG